jgi:hypothetical protein
MIIIMTMMMILHSHLANYAPRLFYRLATDCTFNPTDLFPHPPGVASCAGPVTEQVAHLASVLMYGPYPLL